MKAALENGCLGACTVLIVSDILIFTRCSRGSLALDADDVIGGYELRGFRWRATLKFLDARLECLGTPNGCNTLASANKWHGKGRLLAFEVLTELLFNVACHPVKDLERTISFFSLFLLFQTAGLSIFNL